MSGARGGMLPAAPGWLAVAWLVVFCVVIAVHVSHMSSDRRRAALHGCHALCAAGMAWMFAAGLFGERVPMIFLQMLFANGAGAVAAWLLLRRTWGHSLELVWMALLLDFAAMTAMLLPGRLAAPVAWTLVAGLALEALAPIRGIRKGREARSRATAAGSRIAGAVRRPLVGALAAHARGREALAGARIAMAAGMICMLALMQLGG